MHQTLNAPADAAQEVMRAQHRRLVQLHDKALQVEHDAPASEHDEAADTTTEIAASLTALRSRFAPLGSGWACLGQAPSCVPVQVLWQLEQGEERLVRVLTAAGEESTETLAHTFFWQEADALAQLQTLSAAS